MRWQELNSWQIAKLPREAACVIPIGAIEQHGPHLPLETDRLIAEAISERLDRTCGNALLLMPAISVTCSAHHMKFAGTLSLQHETFGQLISQIVCSAAHHGFHRFLLLNAHGGNMAIGSVIAEKLSQTLPNCDVVFATWFRIAGDSLRPLVQGDYPAVGHACEFETSLVMAIRPELVDRNAIADDGIPVDSAIMRSDLLTGSAVTRPIPFDRITNNGVWGKPSLASAEKGEAILSIVVSRFKDLLADLWCDSFSDTMFETESGDKLVDSSASPTNWKN